MSNDDREVSAHLSRQHTYCETLPRVYSGLAYDFCSLHSNPGGGTYFDGFILFYIFDGVVSGAVDTVLLPYTGYQQYHRGSIDLDKKHR